MWWPCKTQQVHVPNCFTNPDKKNSAASKPDIRKLCYLCGDDQCTEVLGTNQDDSDLYGGTI